MVKRMNKHELFDFMLDIICLQDNSEKLYKLKTMVLGDFNLDVKYNIWEKHCQKYCYKKHLDLFIKVHHAIVHNHSFPFDVYNEILHHINLIKQD